MTLEPISMTLYDTDFPAFSDALGAAFERYGFAVVSDHGLPTADIAGALDTARDLFALPDAVKRGYCIKGGAGQRGYTPFGVETAKGEAKSDLKEFWHVGRDLATDHPAYQSMPPNLWPDEIPAFKPRMQTLFSAFDHLGGRLLRAVARRLGQPEDWLVEAVRDGDSILRLLHYPPLAPDAVGVRAGAHEDINVITLLLGAEEAGLQILDRDGRWIDVQPPEGAIVCNIGDMLQRLTNGLLPSTTHRVVNPSAARRSISRYSMPFFLHFPPEFLIETLPSCVDAARPNLFPTPITSREYLNERLRELRLLT